MGELVWWYFAAGCAGSLVGSALMLWIIRRDVRRLDEKEKAAWRALEASIDRTLEEARKLPRD